MAFRRAFVKKILQSQMFEGYCQADAVTRGRSLSGNISESAFLIGGQLMEAGQ